MLRDEFNRLAGRAFIEDEDDDENDYEDAAERGRSATNRNKKVACPQNFLTLNSNQIVAYV